MFPPYIPDHAGTPENASTRPTRHRGRSRPTPTHTTSAGVADPNFRSYKFWCQATAAEGGVAGASRSTSLANGTCLIQLTPPRRRAHRGIHRHHRERKGRYARWPPDTAAAVPWHSG